MSHCCGLGGKRGKRECEEYVEGLEEVDEKVTVNGELSRLYVLSSSFLLMIEMGFLSKMPYTYLQYQTVQPPNTSTPSPLSRKP